MLAPYYLLALTILMFFIVVLQSIQQEKVLIYRMIFSILYIFVGAVLTYLGLEQTQDILGDILYIVIQIYVFITFTVLLYGAFKYATLKSNHYALFIKAIKNSKFNVYYIVDHQERIKDVSLGFLQELALEKEDVIGKKLHQVLSKSIRIKTIDQHEASIKELNTYHQNYKKNVTMHQADVLDISFLNAIGELTYFHLILQPVFVFGKYKGRIALGEKKTDLEMLAVEKELQASNQELESIRYKFITMLELTEEAMFSMDLKEDTIWLSEPLLKLLRLNVDTLSVDHFKSLIYKEDLEKRQQLIFKLNDTHNTYEITYRILVENTYIWVREKGKKVSQDNTLDVIMGAFYEVKTKHFMNSDIPTLDEVSTYHHIHGAMNKKKLENKFFEILYVRLYNLPALNDRYGRDVGNLLISEYVKQLRKTFVTESGDIFRMSGSTFAVMITDPRKIDMLDKGILTKSPFMDVQMQYGNIQTELKVHGVIMSHTIIKDPESALLLMRDTLRTLGTPMRMESVLRMYE